MVFELLNPCVKSRYAIEHLVMLVLIVFLFSNNFLDLFVLLIDLALQHLVLSDLFVEVLFDAGVRGNRLQCQSLLAVLLDLQVLNLLFILLVDGFVLFLKGESLILVGDQLCLLARLIPKHTG